MSTKCFSAKIHAKSDFIDVKLAIFESFLHSSLPRSRSAFTLTDDFEIINWKKSMPAPDLELLQIMGLLASVQAGVV
jgi:hypothetical protein